MNKLSACLLIIFLISFNVRTFAQKYGLQGGINFSDLVIKDNDGIYGSNKLVGFNAGITIGFEISKIAEFEVDVIVESRGSKYVNENYLWEMRMVYMDIPFLIKVGPTFGRVKIYGAAGPYFGLGLAAFLSYVSGGNEYSSLIFWDRLRRPELGTKFGIGAEAMNFTLGAFYSLGLSNISAVTNNGENLHNTGISICVGYRF